MPAPFRRSLAIEADFSKREPLEFFLEKISNFVLPKFSSCQILILQIEMKWELKKNNWWQEFFKV